MLVKVDIGNTNITIGIFDKEDLISTYRLTTKVRRTSDEYGFLLKNFLDRSNVHEKQIDAVIVSSVVPKVMHSFTNGIKKFVGIEPLIVGPGIKSGISVQLENPRNVGADRIADCAGEDLFLLPILEQPQHMIMWMKMAALKLVQLV